MRVTRGITPPQDYASAAGRALSSRLAANAHTSVLLLEAGPGSAAAWRKIAASSPQSFATRPRRSFTALMLVDDFAAEPHSRMQLDLTDEETLTLLNFARGGDRSRPLPAVAAHSHASRDSR